MRPITQEGYMSRLSAIAMLCVVVSVPALAADEEVALAEEQAIEEVAAARLADLPPEVLMELEPEQIVAILAGTEASEIVDYVIQNDAYDLVALFVPLAFFLTVLLAVVSTHMLRVRKQAQLHQTLRLMIDKGTDIPPELFAPPIAAHSDLRRGLVLVGVGLSLLILIGLVDGFADGSWAVGLIPAFIGAAYLIVWRFSQRQRTAGRRVEGAPLIARVVADDDRHAFATLVRKHQSAVRGFLLRLSCGDRALADDAAQETFLRAYQRIGSYRSEGGFHSCNIRGLAPPGLRRAGVLASRTPR